jgi:hypothetical protein
MSVPRPTIHLAPADLIWARCRDSLDFNLHSAILSSLAANLASSSTQDDLSLLTDSFSTREPVTNGLVNGVLARLGLDQAASTQQEEPIVRPAPRSMECERRAQLLSMHWLYRRPNRPKESSRSPSSPLSLSPRKRTSTGSSLCCPPYPRGRSRHRWDCVVSCACCTFPAGY